MSASAMGGVELHLVATNHLEQIGPDVWRATGNDPNFCVVAPLPLAAGWHELTLDMEQLGDVGAAMQSFLYPDYGQGVLEWQRVFLPFDRDTGAPRRCIVRFIHDVRALRFDPASAVGDFRLGSIHVRQIGKAVAARAMLAALLRRPLPMRRRIRYALGLAKAALRGPRHFAEALYGVYAYRTDAGVSISYQTWLSFYDQRDAKAQAAVREESAALERRPLFSIVVPVYNTPEKWLRRCIKSVLAQSYPDWELCLANDASPQPHVRRVLDEMAARDSRIKVVHRSKNGHIAAASNSALEMVVGDWVVLLDHDDELHPFALFEMAKAINANPRWRLIYSDEDKVDDKGLRYDPYMKPDWNYDLFLSHNCISHLGVYDASLVRELGGFREGLEGSQDWDLALRCIERLDPDQIGHVPKVLYHWRAIPGSTALAPQEKDYAHQAGLRAIAEHLQRIGSRGRVGEIEGMRGNYRVRYTLPDPAPLVSIIIPTRDRMELLRACIESIRKNTIYPRYEILVVDNQSSEPETLRYFERLALDERVRVIPYDAPFNYSAINNHAVAVAQGDVLCLLNNDITVISSGWLEEMVAQACRPGIGAVGAMLYYPNDTIQHAGVIVGAHGIAAHAYSGRARGYPGHMSRARLQQQMTAVTAACLVIRRAIYEEVGGLDPGLEVAFNDIDFCLRVLEKGYRNLWTPFAELYHHESATRGYEDSPEKLARFNREVDYMRQRWPSWLAHDPAYSANHSITEAPYELAFPPRA